MTAWHIPARFLAALIDYLIVSGTAGVVNPDSVLGFFLISSTYFTFGASKRLKGATVGKRLFGLFVTSHGLTENSQLTKDSSGNEKSRPKNGSSIQDASEGKETTTSPEHEPQRGLELEHAFLRFFVLYGLVIVIAEVPRTLFRTIGFESSPEILDFNYFLALTFFFSLVLSSLFTRDNRAWHDLVAKSVVGRTDSIEANPKRLVAPPTILAPWKIWGIAVILAGFLWSIMLPGDPIAREFQSRKFVFSRDFGLEMLGIRHFSDLSKCVPSKEKPCTELQIHLLSGKNLENSIENISALLSAQLDHIEEPKRSEVILSLKKSRKNWKLLFDPDGNLLEKTELNPSLDSSG